MLEALQQVATGEVTVASRDSSVDGIAVRAGDYLALLDGDAVAAGPSFDEANVPDTRLPRFAMVEYA